MAKKAEATTGAAVTFRALLSPKQCFTFGGQTYHFIAGLLATVDAELIAYLEQNPYCEKVQ